MKILFTTFCLLALACGCSPADESEAPTTADSSKTQTAIKHVEGAAAGQLVKDNPEVVVLDIRTPEEFKAGHIPGATNIDFYAEDFAQKVGTLDKDKSYLVHCGSGGRSTKSLEVFKTNEFKTIYHLDGGFKGWESAGNPVSR